MASIKSKGFFLSTLRQGFLKPKLNVVLTIFPFLIMFALFYPIKQRSAHRTQTE